MAVTFDTRIRRAAVKVVADERVNDTPTEHIAQVNDMVRKTQLLRKVFGFHYAFHRAAAFLARQTTLFHRVERAERATHQFVALLQQEQRTHRRVNAARHSHQYACCHFVQKLFAILRHCQHLADAANGLFRYITRHFDDIRLVTECVTQFL